jgi:hypothetical protein
MYSWNDADDRVAIVRMNAELRHAQLELLCARCSTDHLRAGFTAEELAQHADRGVLRKAIGHAMAINDFYLAIQRVLGGEDVVLTEDQLTTGVDCVMKYLWDQREAYISISQPLSASQRSVVEPFFSPRLLDQVRVAELKGQRVVQPFFYERAMELGITNLPPLTHMASLTFVDVIVFNEEFSTRALFHGLVHAAQFQILGLERYTDLFVRSFLKSQAHYNVPLETQAIAMESKFSSKPEKAFPVEDQIRLWARERRY